MATVYTWTDSGTNITWNYLLSGSDAIIGNDSDTNGNATTLGTSLNGNIIIPNTVGGYTVKRIGKRAFAQCAIQTVTIPDTVTEISDTVFASCSVLNTVTFGNNSQCTTLGSTAFYSTDRLVTIALPNSLLSIGQACFQLSKKLPSITIPASVTTMTGQCFAHCTLLTTVVFEQGSQLTNFGSSMFINTGIQSITLPDSMTDIPSFTFRDCVDLTSITIPDSVTSISEYAFWDTPPGLIVTMNTKTIDGTTYTSPNTSYIPFFGNTSVTFVSPPFLTMVSGKVPNWLQPISGQYNATMGGYESGFPAWCSPTSAANQLGHLVDHGGVTQPININDGIVAGNDSPFALATSTIPWDSGHGWGDYILDGPSYRGQITIPGFVTDFGWYMNTNNLGPLGNGAGSPVGSTLLNIYNGMVDFYQQVGYTNMVGMVYHFNGTNPSQQVGVEPAYWTANGHNAGAGVSADYTVTLNTIKHEIDNNRTVMACFNVWNIADTGDGVLTGMTSNEDETGIYKKLGAYETNGPHGEVFNIETTDGGNVEIYNAGLGHTVLIVGYIPAGSPQDPTNGVTNWLVVRDNYTTSHKNVIIQFDNLTNLLATVYVNHTTATYSSTIGGTDYADGTITIDTNVEKEYPPSWVRSLIATDLNSGSSATYIDNVTDLNQPLNISLNFTSANNTDYAQGTYNFFATNIRHGTGSFTNDDFTTLRMYDSLFDNFNSTSGFAQGWQTQANSDLSVRFNGEQNHLAHDLLIKDLGNNTTTTITGEYSTVEFPEYFQITKCSIWGTKISDILEYYILGYDDTNGIYDQLYKSPTNNIEFFTSNGSTEISHTITSSKIYKKYALMITVTVSTWSICSELRFYGYPAVVGPPTSLSFATNTLTIENSINATDTDKVSFVLPAGSEMRSLNVTTFVGTGTISYTLSTTGATDITGTFTSTGTNLLTGNPLIASSGVDITYILTLTADTEIIYSIEGTKVADAEGTMVTGPPLWENLTVSNEQIFNATNKAADDNFGYSVSISGNYAIVGSSSENTFLSNSGAAYIFERNETTGTWSETQMLKSSNIEFNGAFGFSVSISGNYAIVGAHVENTGYAYSGAVFIFERDTNGIWGTAVSGETYYNENQMFKASNIENLAKFGTSVSINGTYAIVGAQFENTIVDDAGAAYIIERDTNGIWGTAVSGQSYYNETQMLKASNAGEDDEFGVSVSISGNYAIVGAMKEDTTSADSGAAYIFERDANGNWGTAVSGQTYRYENKMLKASNAGDGTSEKFGNSVSIDGTYAIVGADYEDTSGTDSGAAYIFERDANGNWGTAVSGQSYYTENKMLKASNAGDGTSEKFGRSVSIDGTYAIVGASHEDTTADDSGAAYIFKRDANGNWGTAVSDQTYRSETKMIKASDAGMGWFGWSVAISGTYIIVGAPTAEISSTTYGTMYIYEAPRIPTMLATSLSFATNTLTIENSINATDTDNVSFVLPTGEEMVSLNVTNFVGTGTISYTLSTTGATDITGTFTSTGTNLLAGNLLVANSGADITYTLTLTADAGITYTIEGTKSVDYGTTVLTTMTGYDWSNPTEIMVKASSPSYSEFGHSVAISGDYAIIGAYKENTHRNESGSAYIFKRDNSNGTWSQTAELKLASAYVASYDYYGFSVEINGDYAFVGSYPDSGGNVAVPHSDSSSYNDSGAVWIWKKDSGAETWTWIQYLKASVIQAESQFGYSVASDGDYLAVGADEHDNDGSVYIFKRDSSTDTWVQQAILTASNGGGGDHFGWSVAIDGDYIVVGAPEEDNINATIETDQWVSAVGAAYVFKRDSGAETWTQTQYLKASNRDGGDHFGHSVAINGDYIVVGAYRESSSSASYPDNDNKSLSGAAYVFKRYSGAETWAQTQFLKSEVVDTNDNFGWSVAIQGDTVLVGAKAEESLLSTNQHDDSGNNVGAVFMFKKDSNAETWTQTSYIKASNMADSSYFGSSIAVNGSYIIIGASRESTTVSGSGAGYILEGSASTTTVATTEPTTLTFSNNILTIENSINASDIDKVSFVLPAGTEMTSLNVTNFAGSGTISYTLSTTGATNITGTFTSTGTNMLAGNPLIASSGVDMTYTLTLTADAVITYTIEGTKAADYGVLLNTPNWTTMTEKIITATSGNDNDQFGKSVSISGSYAIVGAWQESTNGYRSGKAYIFKRNNIAEAWSQHQILESTHPTDEDFFGKSVSISGNYAIVSAHKEDSNSITDPSNNDMGQSGAAYMYKRNETTDVWEQQQTLKATPIVASHYFGQSVSISGNYAIVGAVGDSTDQSWSGAVFVFELNETTGVWTQKQILKSTTVVQNAQFGFSASIHGDYAIIGAGFEDHSTSITKSGAVYIFERNVTTNVWTQTAVFKLATPNTYDQYGYSVSIHGDYAIAGAPWEDTNADDAAGAAIIFERNGTTGVWTEKQTLKASPIVASGTFGKSVSISGNYAIIGSPAPNTGEGQAYIFERNETTGTWTQKHMITPSDGTWTYYFGEAVFMSDNYTIVGAWGVGPDVGAAYIIEPSFTTTISPTALAFSNNILTIENNINASDTDSVSFVIPAGYCMGSLNVTNFSGSGTISYTLSTTGATDITGTFTSTGTNLLDGNPVIGHSGEADITYTLTLTADAVSSYTIEGTKVTPTALTFSNNILTIVNSMNANDTQFVSFVIPDGDELGSLILTNFSGSGKIYFYISTPGVDDITGNYTGPGSDFLFGRPLISNSGVDLTYILTLTTDGAINYTIEGTKTLDYTNISPTSLDFSNNILTIENSLNYTDTDKVSFVLPAGYEMRSLIRAFYLGFHSTSYTLSTTGATDITGTFTFGGTNTNLLDGNPLIANSGADITYTLTLTTDAPFGGTGVSAGVRYRIEGTKVIIPTALSFTNNILTIGNSINANDTDRVSFVLPAGKEMIYLNVTNFSGSGTISYKLSTPGATDITGTFNSTQTGTNLLDGNPLFANSGADITYILDLTSDAAITYTIVGKKNDDYIGRVDPVIHYTFDTGDGTNSGTLAGNHNLTIPSAFTVSESAKYSGAKGLTVGDSPTSIPTSSDMQTSMDTWWTTTDAFTISMWAYFKNGHFANARLLSWGYFPGSGSYYQTAWFESPTVMKFYTGDAQWSITIPDMFTTPPNWHNFIFIYEGKTIKVYIDGVLYLADPGVSNEYTHTATIRTFSGQLMNNFWIGYHSNSPPLLNGYVDDVRIYDYALSVDDISGLYNNVPAYTTVTFNNNILTIENSIDNGVDAVSFILPVGDEMHQLVVTNCIGTGIIFYEITVGGTSIKTGTFTSTGTGTNLLDGIYLISAISSTYIVSLTANAAMTYTIIGTKAPDTGSVITNYGGWGSEVTDETYRTETKLLDGPTYTTNPYFGSLVRIYGDYMIVSAPSEDNTDSQGSVYIYKRDISTGWPTTHTAKLVVTDGDGSEYFGGALAMNENYIVIGAKYDNSLGTDINVSSGTAYIFEQNGSGDWTQTVKLGTTDANTSNFGISVAIHGNYIVVGSGATIHAAASNNGAVYIYELINGTWGTEVSNETYRTETKRILPSISSHFDNFGTSVAIHGNYIVVGARSEDSDGTDQSNNNLPGSGAAYLFERDNSTGWPSTETKFLKSPTPIASGEFGDKLIITENYIVIGEPKDSGAAYIYERDSTNGWPDTPTKKITAGDVSADKFGQEIAMNENENILVIGASDSHSAYIFNKDPSTGWPDTATIKLLPLVDADAFGWSVSIYENYIAVGARLAGKAYIFEQPVTVTMTPTSLVFTNNVLTIDNITSTTDTDAIDFVLPAGYKITELNVTNFNGTGNVSYTLTTGGNTITSGTFSAINSNLLPSGFPIFAPNTDVTYILTITADNTIGYTIVGTKTVTNIDDYSITTLLAGGYTEQILIDAGKWDADSNANHFNSTYIEGFFDISGNVKVTDNILMDNGDIDLHSYTITDPHVFTADVSNNNRLFVIGDVSMGDASLNIVGDISITGVMSVGSYKSQSISEAAIIGGNSGFSTANSITTFTEDIAYNKKIQFNGDVYGNSDATTYFGPNTTLKANTGIEFPDGTTLHSSNKETDGTTFKASKFNNMTTIGDFSSTTAVTVTSDYRIKTNIETLDETHIVDNLRPVKYKQTQTGKNDIGFLAHELQEHYPELVEGEKDGDKMQSVNYNGLLPILINEVQQLKKQIAETRARIHNETP
jgi:hypothetical protein